MKKKNFERQIEALLKQLTLAEKIRERLGGAEIYTGKDYLRFAKNENDAKRHFRAMLENETEELK